MSVRSAPWCSAFYKSGLVRSESDHSNSNAQALRMPASPNGFAHYFVDRSVAMSAGYQVLGCAPGVQQPPPPPPHLAAMAGMPVPFSGIPGYTFIPFPHSGHMSHMGSSYDLKSASPYHQALLSRGGAYFSPYRPVVADEPGRVAKVASRESTGALKAWLSEHLKNPYPTKGEKIMLAIVTKMSLTQVSTWFANARRRLKKENRVSWASKAKSDEDEEADESEGEEDEDDEGSLQKDRCSDDEVDIDPQIVEVDAEEQESAPPRPGDARLTEGLERTTVQEQGDTSGSAAVTSGSSDARCESARKECKVSANGQKPKIWSLAETATSETPVQKSTEHCQDFSKWWANWASRNSYLPPNYSAHFLQQS